MKLNAVLSLFLVFALALLAASPQGGPGFSEGDLDRMIAAQQNTFSLVQKCQIASFDPPDPENRVSLINILGLENGKCKILMRTDKGDATYLLTQETYSKISSIQDLTKGECTGECEYSKSVQKAPETQDEGELCMRSCIVKDCSLGELACEKQNKEKCEKECDMLGDAPDVENMGKEERCIFECVSSIAPGTICGRSKEGETGNEVCQKCAADCVHLYEGPCLGEEKLEQKKKECETCAHCYGAPVMGDSGEGYECIVDVKCADASAEWGDNPGSGPDSYEPGREPSPENEYFAGYDASLELEDNSGSLLIEGEGLAAPISVGINANEGISLEQRGDKLIISDSSSDSGRQIEIENNLKRVMFSPEGRQLDIERISVGVEKDRPIYEYEEREKARLFGIIPIDKNTRKKVDAESLDVLEKHEPWWSLLAIEDKG